MKVNRTHYGNQGSDKQSPTTSPPKDFLLAHFLETSYAQEYVFKWSWDHISLIT